MSWVCRACRSVSIRTASNWAAARRTEPARPHGPRRPSAPVGEVPRRTRPERVPVDPFHVKPGVSDQVGARQPDHGRQKGRALDLEKRLRRAGKPKNEPVISKAAQEKKAKKAASAASPLPSHPQRHRSAKSLAVPSVTTVARLGQLLGRKIGSLQSLMARMGHENVRPDRVLTSDDAALIVLESGFEPVVDDALAFDIYPDPLPRADARNLEPRPPVVCIMGHVDHGKTTLLDSLRSSSVAAGEAGGITQHIGAFEVALGDIAHSAGANPHAATGPRTVTFLDTPGHAAFAGMRSRGADLTDVIVLVVAADDGVKSQTKEVIGLLRSVDAGVVVAITKCDKPGVDMHRVRASLLEAGVEIEQMGGDVPCVEVSALTRRGLPELVETILAVSEVREHQVERQGVRFQGRIIESVMTKEHGAVATVLCQRGTLVAGSVLVAGQTYARTRRLLSPSGLPQESGSPGQPVRVIGWKDVPEAGSEVLAADDEASAKRATENRIRRSADREATAEIEVINQKRSQAKEELLAQRLRMQPMTNRERKAYAWTQDQQARAERQRQEGSVKEVRLVVKADTAGTLQAVVASLSALGTDQVAVDIVDQGVGAVSEKDAHMAVAAEATVVGFNVSADRPASALLGQHAIDFVAETVIYRLVELVQSKVAALLPPSLQERVAGEATVVQVFELNAKTRNARKIAGCRVTNGHVAKDAKVRVTRNGRVLWEGPLEQLKHGKKDVGSIVKGGECGMAFQGFQDIAVGDKIVSVEVVQRGAR